ncbi:MULTISPECIES: chorismate mutase [Aerococcus]|uniref:Chorismate mutase n=1 Tax=Aerococcus sanguinicola TaxID=119206 RepID=A0A5N1GKS2_9LACT|nr:MULTISPECIES: chorismate mutase [Aerococcus]KAA9300916.1 chorismate mutase [Aerococcus sanguinicola]MDK6369149.1 chorismate mutase [Aerococcus sp. UMB9870]MDK6679791.1 chorismate mutase [Aerococcus sp. UMB8608]MDK6686642.1 chorismate mutase [Aerococcus sp. UMB8623]MDK6939713.1 chorismate mutase [Aerococcus sp. UMB8487]
MSLDQERQKINQIDQKIVALYEDRLKVSEAIARLKATQGADIFVADREQAVIDHVLQGLEDPANADSVRALYQEIMRLSRERQKEVLAADETNPND